MARRSNTPRENKLPVIEKHYRIRDSVPLEEELGLHSGEPSLFAHSD